MLTSAIGSMFLANAVCCCIGWCTENGEKSRVGITCPGGAQEDQIETRSNSGGACEVVACLPTDHPQDRERTAGPPPQNCHQACSSAEGAPGRYRPRAVH